MINEIENDHLNPILDAIDAAEEIFDPLDGLVEKTASEAGAAFTPEMLVRLAALKKEDRAAFEALRAKLKKAGCRVTALDEAIAEETGDGGRGPTQADILIDLAGAADLFHSADGLGLRRRRRSTAIARPGRFAPRASAAGWRGSSSRRPAARQAPRRCNRRSTSSRPRRISMARNVQCSSASAVWTGGSTSTSAMTLGERWKSTPPAGG